MLVYEDNYRILHDLKFYVSYGFEFLAEANKTYTIRFIDEGKIGKLVALEMSKTTAMIEGKADRELLEGYGLRISNLAYELKVPVLTLRSCRGFPNLASSCTNKTPKT